jgi:hypothetical protein
MVARRHDDGAVLPAHRDRDEILVALEHERERRLDPGHALGLDRGRARDGGELGERRAALAQRGPAIRQQAEERRRQQDAGDQEREPGREIELRA